MKPYFFLFIGLFVLSFHILKLKPFPELNHQNSQGELITNDYFKNQDLTLVVYGYLGCSPMMNLMKDLQTLSEQNVAMPKVLIVFQNTESEFEQFNGLDENRWSKLRVHYNLEPIIFDVITECERSKSEYKDGDFIVVPSCRKLGKKLKTKSSPTLVFVNKNGLIIKMEKGYYSKSNTEKLLIKIKTVSE